MLRKSFLLLFLFVQSLFAQGQAYIEKRGNEIAIGNPYIERVIGLSPKDFGTLKIINKLSGHTYRVRDDVFALRIVFSGLGPAPGADQNGENDVILTAKDFRFDGYKESELYAGGKKLTLDFTFDWEMTDFHLAVNYEIDTSRFSMRKWIDLSDSSFGIQFLDRIYVESMSIEGADYSDGKFGQPVLNKDIFLGVEYPTVENIVDGNTIRIGYVVGKEIKSEPYTSHRSIIGVSPSVDKLEQTFLDYVDGIKVDGTRPYLLYNSWYDLRNPAITRDSSGIMTEQTVLTTISSFREHLYDDYHIKLDGFVLDDAWDNYKSLWGIDSSRFPHGFTPFVNALSGMSTRLGLWASPFCGYSNRDIRVNWAASHGYEKTGDFLCFAGKKYGSAFKEIMDDYARQYELGYFKWDGFLLSCNEPDHGHLPGLYSREANVSAYIDIMKSVRKINPEIFLNITSGTWLSPWWLKYADCIWMQGEDYGYQESVPSLNERDKAITYKDAVLWDDYQKLHLLFPMSSLMTHGIIKGRFNLLGGANESLDSFGDEVMMYFGRGVMMWELYISPELLSPGEWKDIASAVKWAKENKDVLDKTKMVLGNPEKGEVYGYVHFTKAKGIILLRNPNIQKQGVNLRLTEDLGDLDPRTEYYVKINYPYSLVLPKRVKVGGTLSLDLNGYEVLEAELIPSDKIQADLPVGIRYDIENGKLVVFGEQGKRQVIMSVSNKNLGSVEFGNDAGRVNCKSEFQLEGDDSILVDHSVIDVPPIYNNARFGILYQPETKLGDSAQPEFKIKVNGDDKTVFVEKGDGSWFWVTSDLSAGRDSVYLSIGLHKGVKGNVGLWLEAERTLVSRVIEGVVVTKSELEPAQPFPGSVRRELIPLSHYRSESGE